uniref:Agenet domain-containing protein n=1 Tax=Brassica campestris TaxID=3711 RepID=A0A3P5Z109_BRACM|nr:unnamed protein product [Brassica rapa]
MSTENQPMVKGSEVEVSSQEEGLKGAYFTALLKENTTLSAVQQSLLRPVPPEEEYAGVVLEEGTVVDAYLRDGWWTGVVINKKLEDNNFLVCFDSPPDIIVFEKTNLRAHVDWTDSKWVPPDLKAARELGNKKADACVMNNETPQVITPIAKVSAPVVTPSPPVIAATPTETEGQLSSEPRSKQNGLEKNDSIPPHKMPEEEETSQVLSRKRRREEEQQQHSDVNETEVSSSSSHQTPNVMMMNSAASVEETPPPALLKALPFAKRSPYWKSPEAKEGYKTMPQRPHFSPLLAAAAEYVNHREWSAVGMTVSFYGFLEQVKGLKPHDSLSVLCSLSESFVELEEYGFDIGAPQSRIRKMMSLKEEQAKIAEEKQCLEKKVDEDEKRSRELAEEMDVLKGKMLELQRQEAVAREEKEAADKRVVEMKASGERFEQKMEDVELEFLETASAPW